MPEVKWYATPLVELNATEAITDADRLAAGVCRCESLELGVVELDAGEYLRSIRIIAGDVDEARAIFDSCQRRPPPIGRSLPSACPTFLGRMPVCVSHAETSVLNAASSHHDDRYLP